MAGIKGIQYGSLTLSSTQFSDNYSLTTVVRGRSALFNLGNSITSGGGFQDGLVRLTISADGQFVTATRVGNTDTLVVNFCVLEFN